MKEERHHQGHRALRDTERHASDDANLDVSFLRDASVPHLHRIESFSILNEATVRMNPIAPDDSEPAAVSASLVFLLPGVLAICQA